MATVTDPRRRMVRRQIAGRGIADRHVLAAMKKVPSGRPGVPET